MPTPVAEAAAVEPQLVLAALEYHRPATRVVHRVQVEVPPQRTEDSAGTLFMQRDTQLSHAVKEQLRTSTYIAARRVQSIKIINIRASLSYLAPFQAPLDERKLHLPPPLRRSSPKSVATLDIIFDAMLASQLRDVQWQEGRVRGIKLKSFGHVSKGHLSDHF